MDIIGIDLGTTNSVATVFDNDALQHVMFEGDAMLPSVVNISDNGVLVGRKAKNIAVIEPQNSALSIKRKMGSDESKIVNNKDYTPEEISSFILQKIKEEANCQFQKEFKRTVITVPAYFNEKQREATAKAAKLAGLEPLRVLNEPTAAAISYGADKDTDAVYAIYDLGGGTFDISIIENSEGLIEVLSTTGNNHLGGDDFDKALVDLIWEKSGFDIERSTRIELKLLQLAEKVKIALSDEEAMEIDEKFFAKKENKPLHLAVTITKKEFEALIEASITETISLLEKAVEEADIEFEDLHAILLTGGSSRIPLISEKVLEETGILPILIDDPDKSVSIGAILQGAMIDGKDTTSILIDITPYSLGTDVINDFGEHELSKIILKNTPIPTSKTSRYYAVAPYQKAYQISVYQGEEKNLDYDVEIGSVFLELENPVEDGAVDVTFSLDANGILNVKGVDVYTGETTGGKFKSQIAHTTHHESKTMQTVISDHDKTILDKIELLLQKESILEEDKADLKALKEKFLHAEGDEKESLEEEIIDTLFFLEEE